jgi:multidrug efflux pump subunit AcrA (membrane-fusion protein)
MKLNYPALLRLTFTAMALLLAACTPAAPAPSAGATSRPPVAAADNIVRASVRVEPAQSSDLGFLISASVKEVLVREGDGVEAGQALVVLDAPQLELGVQAAKEGLLAAERDEFIQSQGRRKWDGFKFVWVAGPPEQRTIAHARVLQSQAALAAATAALEQSVLRAPFDGTVVAIGVQPGEVVQPAQVVASVGDLTHLLVETTDLSERDIARVRVGQAANVTLDAFVVPLGGAVSLIEPRAGRSANGDVIYKITIDLSSQPQQLLWGMTGTAEVQIDS